MLCLKWRLPVARLRQSERDVKSSYWVAMPVAQSY